MNIIAWGYNSHGQCTIPSPNIEFVEVAGGGYHSLGLKSDCSIVTWGNNDYGQCNGLDGGPPFGFIAIAAGLWHSMGLKPGHFIITWGRNLFGECTVPSPNTDFMVIAAGNYHSLGLRSNGSIAAWGWDYYGQCDVPEPNTYFVKMAGGGYHTLGIRPTAASCDLFISGPQQITTSGDLFIHGLEACTTSGDLLVHGHEDLTASEDLFVCGHRSLSTSGDLFIHGHHGLSTSKDLFIYGHEDSTASDDLFTHGHDNSIASGTLFIANYYVGSSITLLINGYEPRPALVCPILDPTATIQIKASLITTYQTLIDDLIDQLGKDVLLEFDPIRAPCPNCEYDIVRKRSTGVYKVGGPRPFARGRQCPYCKGHGFTETEVNKTIKCLTKWNPNDAEDFGIVVEQKQGIVRLKTYLTEADDLMRTKTIVVDYDIVSQMKLRVRLIKGPIPVGLREDRYCISFWRLI